MTTLEVVLTLCLIVEASISAYFWRKHKKMLDNERKLYEAKREEYERLIQSLPIGRNLL